LAARRRRGVGSDHRAAALNVKHGRRRLLGVAPRSIVGRGEDPPSGCAADAPGHVVRARAAVIAHGRAIHATRSACVFVGRFVIRVRRGPATWAARGGRSRARTRGPVSACDWSGRLVRRGPHPRCSRFEYGRLECGRCRLRALGRRRSVSAKERLSVLAELPILWSARAASDAIMPFLDGAIVRTD
jgi:hypothetical protein